MRARIAGAATRDVIYQIGFFKGCDRTFLNTLSSSMISEVFSPGNYIIRKNEYVNSLFVISNGTAERVAADDATVRVASLLFLALTHTLHSHSHRHSY